MGLNSNSVFKHIFRALKHRNYRLFFTGQSISLIGSWMQQIAMSWMVYRMYNSALLLGVVGFVGQIPTFIISPFAGVIADRHNRHHLLVITQTLAMIQALILSILVLSNTIVLWEIVALSLFSGFINSFDMPIRQSFTVEMLENSEDLGNAIALNSSMVNMAKLVGPSIAGVLIAAFGEGTCFLLNALSYLAVIASLLLMRVYPPKINPVKKHILHELKEGFNYAFGFEPIRVILLLLALISLMGVPYQVLMPVFAKDIFHGGPETLGIIMASSGVGALIGAVYLASRKNVRGLGRLITIAAGLFGVGIIAISFSRNLWVSAIFVLAAGFGMMVGMAGSNTILQTITEEDKRGRIMSFFTMAFMGMVPFGNLLAGYMAHKLGAPKTLLIGGICCVLGSGIFAMKLPALRKKIRPIYVKKGIIPEVAAGIESATLGEIPLKR